MIHHTRKAHFFPIILKVTEMLYSVKLFFRGKNQILIHNIEFSKLIYIQWPPTWVFDPYFVIRMHKSTVESRDTKWIWAIFHEITHILRIPYKKKTPKILSIWELFGWTCDFANDTWEKFLTFMNATTCFIHSNVIITFGIC